MHSVAKLLSKILANRLAPHLPTLVSPCQSAFIKGRSIKDNFQYVQGVVNHYHRVKTPMLFLKLDVAKAFDSVRWDYILEVFVEAWIWSEMAGHHIPPMGQYDISYPPQWNNW